MQTGDENQSLILLPAVAKHNTMPIWDVASLYLSIVCLCLRQVCSCSVSKQKSITENTCDEQNKIYFSFKVLHQLKKKSGYRQQKSLTKTGWRVERILLCQKSSHQGALRVLSGRQSSSQVFQLNFCRPEEV